MTLPSKGREALQAWRSPQEEEAKLVSENYRPAAPGQGRPGEGVQRRLRFPPSP